MAIADEKPETPPTSSDPADIAGNLMFWALRLVFYLASILVVVVCGILGLATGGVTGLSIGTGTGLIGGILGLILGIALGIVVVVAVVVGVFYGAMAVIFLLGYLFLIDLDANAEAAAQAEGNGTDDEKPVVFWPPPPYRAALIVAITAVLWVKYGLPALERVETWPQFRDTVPAAVVLPLGLIGMVMHHWLAILGERMSGNSRPRPIGGCRPAPPTRKPDHTDLAEGPGPG